jgi:membrane protease YdiL (CAAX protease family)
MTWLANLPVAYKLVVIAVAMTVEEGFFRAFLQTRIGWIPSSVLFALGHAGYGLPMMLFSVFVISLVIGWTLRRRGRLLPCIVAHGVFDSIQLLVIMPVALKVLEQT